MSDTTISAHDPVGFDDVTVEALLTGDAGALGESAAGHLSLMAALDDLRALGGGPVPMPSAALADLMYENVVPLYPPTRRAARRVKVSGWLVAGAAVVIAGATYAASQQELPDPAQRVVSRVVNNLTPFHIEPTRESSGSDRSPGQAPSPQPGRPGAGAGSTGGTPGSAAGQPSARTGSQGKGGSGNSPHASASPDATSRPTTNPNGRPSSGPDAGAGGAAQPSHTPDAQSSPTASESPAQGGPGPTTNGGTTNSHGPKRSAGAAAVTSPTSSASSAPVPLTTTSSAGSAQAPTSGKTGSATR